MNHIWLHPSHTRTGYSLPVNTKCPFQVLTGRAGGLPQARTPRRGRGTQKPRAVSAERARATGRGPPAPGPRPRTGSQVPRPPASSRPHPNQPLCGRFSSPTKSPHSDLSSLPRHHHHKFISPKPKRKFPRLAAASQTLAPHAQRPPRPDPGACTRRRRRSPLLSCPLLLCTPQAGRARGQTRRKGNTKLLTSTRPGGGALRRERARAHTRLRPGPRPRDPRPRPRPGPARYLGVHAGGRHAS